MQKVKVAIIGGGVAGLMCARELEKKGVKDFVVISKDIGGRVICSSNRKVNYGAYFVTKTYKNLKPFLQFLRPIRKKDCLFVKSRKIYTIFSFHFVPNIFSYLRLILGLIKFRIHFERFRKNTLKISQKKAIELDPYLSKLYFTKASDFIEQKRLQKYEHEYLDAMANAMSFSDPNKASAFLFLQWASEMLLYTLYEFYMDIPKMINNFKEKIIIDTVKKIDYNDGKYIVKTENNLQIESSYLVMAAEPWLSKDIIDVKLPEYDFTNAHMWHIAGNVRETYKKKIYVFFPAKASFIVLARQLDDTYIVYADNKDVDLGHCFIDYQIIFEKDWVPAFQYNRYDIFEAEKENGLYFIGSQNLDGLEDSAITGVWAARKIINACKK